MMPTRFGTIWMSLACSVIGLWSQPVAAQTPSSLASPYSLGRMGNENDAPANPNGGVLVVGGSTDQRDAMAWFLGQADGGDVLILRASGGDGYNRFLFDMGGVNSVESLMIAEEAATNDPYVLRRIAEADGLFFAGGDQWNYVRLWQNTPLLLALREAIHVRKAVVGGTSAGAAVLGSHIFDARNGTVTGEEALADPFDLKISLFDAPFLELDPLKNVVVDQHFSQRDRQGRLVAFLARNESIPLRGIGVDERTALAVVGDGSVQIFGEGGVYFVQSSGECHPERLQPGQALTWDCGGRALKVARLDHESGILPPMGKIWDYTASRFWSVVEGKLRLE